MNRNIISSVLLSTLPFAATAQELPLYIDNGGELTFTGTMLDDAELNDIFGGRGIIDIFGVPQIIVKDAQTGAPRPVYIPPEQYEIVYGADGVVKDQHDDLTFSESEGSDLRDDLEFAENEGSDTREDLSFTADEALIPDVTFDGPQDFFAGGPIAFQPQNGVWRVQLNATNITGCPPGVGEMAAAQVAQSRTADITFGASGWTPVDLNPDYASFVWGPNGPNGFYAQPYALEAAGSGMALSVSIALAAKSETRIDVWARVLLNLTPMLAKMAGGAEVCTAIVTGAYTKN